MYGLRSLLLKRLPSNCSVNKSYSEFVKPGSGITVSRLCIAGKYVRISQSELRLQPELRLTYIMVRAKKGQHKFFSA